MYRKDRKSYFYDTLKGIRALKKLHENKPEVLADIVKEEEYFEHLSKKYTTHEEWVGALTNSVIDYRDNKLSKAERREHDDLVDKIKRTYLSVSNPLVATVKPCLEDLKFALSHHPRKYAGMLELIDRYITIHEKAEEAQPKVRVVKKAPNRIVEQLRDASNPVKRVLERYKRKSN